MNFHAYKNTFVTRTLTFVALFSLIACLFVVSTSVHALSDHLVLSEVVVDVTGVESAGEMVEIYNPTGDTVDIGGWDIAYKTATGSSWSAKATFPSGSVIAPYSYFLIGGDGVSPTPDYVDTSLGFSGTGGHVALRDGSNNFVDLVGYGGANDPESAAISAPGQDKSLERKPGFSDTTAGNGQDGDDNSVDFQIRETIDPQNAASGSEVPSSVAGSIASEVASLKGLSGTSNVTVTDADRNNKGYSAETFSITVTSVADPTGITLTLQETSNSASTFDLASSGSELGLTLGSSDASNRLIKVRATGDTITVTYQDPAPYQSTTATIAFGGMGDVVINEVVFNPTGTDQGNEWVELYNTDTETINLAGWTLTDEDAGTVMEMPSDVSLPAGAFLLWYVDASGANDTDFSDGTGTIYSGTATTVSLTNTNDQVSLYASTTRDANTIQDFMQYSTNDSVDGTDAQNAVDAGIWPTTTEKVDATAAPEDAGLTLNPDGDDHNTESDWSIDSSSTPGVTNDSVTASSAPANLDAVTAIEQINIDWEAATAGSDPLAGYRLYRSSDAITYSEISGLISDTEYHDTNVVVGDTFYYGVLAEDINGARSDTSNIDFAAANPYETPGTPANLVAAGNPFQNDLLWDTPSTKSYPHDFFEVYRSQVSGSYGSALATVTAPATVYNDTNVAVGQQYFYVVRVLDTSGVASDTSNEATVVAQGYADPPPPGENIQINEIMYDAPTPEPDNEWVELFNPTDTPISIGGLFFEDNVGSFEIPAGNTVPAQSYFVLGYSSGAAGGIVDLVYGMTAANISFANSGDTVTLRTDTQIVDQVGYQGSWDGDEPYSLSRKFSGTVSQDQTSWGKSIDTNGTPGAVNYVDTLPPLITHTPKSVAAAGKDIGIQSVITDNIAKEVELGKAWLYYRTEGETAYTQLTMNRVAIEDWTAIIPSIDVETPAIEYYMEAMDPSNNIGTFATSDTPQSISIVTIDTKIVINEFMYDPATNEPDNEWIEIYNYGNTSENLSGWKLSDGEDEFIIPDGTSIDALGYVVFERSESATVVSGIVYGDSAPSLKLQNLLGVVTDQITLSDHNNLVIDEVNYASTWGAHNVGGPNNVSLERIDPEGESNSDSNWIYAYVQDGSPGDTNTSKMVRDLVMSPTFINTLIGETTRIRFAVHVDSDIAGNTAAVKIRILASNQDVAHTIYLEDANTPGVHYYDTYWSGNNANGDTLLDVFQVEIVATDANGEVSTHKIDDRTFLGFNDQYSTFQMFSGEYSLAQTNYFLAKPSVLTINIQEDDGGPHVRTLIDSTVVGDGNQVVTWDLRRDDGQFHLSITGWPFIAEPLPGNALIGMPKYEITGDTISPGLDFDPSDGETFTLIYNIVDSSTVTITIRDEGGNLVRTIATNADREVGSYTAEWDGKDDFAVTVDQGLYLMILDGETIDSFQKHRFVQPVGVLP